MQLQIEFGPWVHFAVKLAKLLKEGREGVEFLIKLQTPNSEKAIHFID